MNSLEIKKHGSWVRVTTQWINPLAGKLPFHQGVWFKPWLLCLLSNFLLCTGGAEEDGSSTPAPGTPHRRPRLSSRLLAVPWPSPNYGGHSGSEPAGG